MELLNLLDEDLASSALLLAVTRLSRFVKVDLDFAMYGRPKSCNAPFDGHFAMPGLPDFLAAHVLAMIADHPRNPKRYIASSFGKADTAVWKGLVPGQR